MQHPGKINLVLLQVNHGQQAATLEGVKAARGDKIVVLDADLQDRPERILDLEKNLLSSMGACFIKRQGLYQAGGRMMTSRLLKLLIQLFSGLHFRAGSYYMIDATLKNQVLSLAARVRYPYLTVIVALSAQETTYIEAKRGMTNEPSSFTFSKRVKAAYQAIFCAIQCRLVRKSSL